MSYYDYAPCAECTGLPIGLFERCLEYYGCAVPVPALYGLGQAAPAPRTMMMIGAGVSGVVAVGGIVWWLSNRRKRKKS